MGKKQITARSIGSVINRVTFLKQILVTLKHSLMIVNQYFVA